MRAICVAMLAMSSLSVPLSSAAQASTTLTAPEGNFPNSHVPSGPDRAMEVRLRAQAEMAMAVAGARAKEPVCYSLRNYRFSRPEVGSDVTKPVGYSTCQKADGFTYRQADKTN